MAGGRASRLAASGIATSKPLLMINGAPLMSFILREFWNVGVRECRVEVGPNDEHVEAWLETVSKTMGLEFTVIVGEHDGTLAAVKRLVAGVETEMLLSTCDVVCRPGMLKEFMIGLDKLATVDPVAVIGLTSHVHDRDPIWVKTGQGESGIYPITRMGKGGEPEETCFANVRWFPRGAGQLISKVISERTIQRDSDLLGALVEVYPERVYGIDCGEVADVDDADDIGDALNLLRKWSQEDRDT